MKWSKLKSVTENRFAPSVHGKVELWTTAYRTTEPASGRGWITINGAEVANFSKPSPLRLGDAKTDSNQQTTLDLQHACWEMTRIKIQDAIRSEDPLLRILSLLDARFGKRRLKSFDRTSEHPLVVLFLDFRLRQEGIRPSHPST